MKAVKIIKPGIVKLVELAVEFIALTLNIDSIIFYRKE
ncbi:hypothetical protein ES708_31629 [subsurface metagenome]